MKRKHFGLTLDIGTKAFTNFPDECPECNQIINPIYRDHFNWRDTQTYYVTLGCPSSACGVCFVYVFEYNDATDECDFMRMIKGRPKEILFSEHINILSPNFCKIYNEAEIAESLNLMEICGVGYRKALEFVIKDYLILLYKNKEEDIKKKLLGACIKEYVSNENIKNTAKRAAWLGNDETHYIRVWKEKDLKDLKLLIKLTIHWIEMEILTQELIVDMPEK
jgi:hypothetical protein